MEYIRFYTKGRYMGKIKKTSFQEQVLELTSWIKSGNDLKWKQYLINDIQFIYFIYN